MKKPVELFLHLDQSAKPNHRFACTIYSSAINLYYNTGFKLEQEDIDILVDSAIAKGILNPKWGGGLEDNFMLVYSYAKKKFPELKYKIFNKEDKDFVELLNQSFMIRVGIQVNREYTYDSQDNGIIDEKDYRKLKGNTENGDIINHATNVIKWLREGEDKDKKFIFDSYFGRKKFNLYQVSTDIPEILMFNSYVFYVD